MQRVAVFDFIPRNVQELPLTKGDIIQTISTQSDVGLGWWIGKKTTLEGSLIGVFPANYTSSINSIKNERVYSPKVSQNILKMHKDIGFLRGGTPQSLLAPDILGDNTIPSPAFSSNLSTVKDELYLQQKLIDKENKIVILEKTNTSLELQLQKIAKESEHKVFTMEKQLKEIMDNNQHEISKLKLTIQNLEEQYTCEKEQWRQQIKNLEDGKNADIAKLQEVCKLYKLEVLDLKNQLELEEQTVQALEDYRLNLEQDLQRLENSVPNRELGNHKNVSRHNTQQAKLLEQHMFEVKSKFFDLLSMLNKI